VIRLQFNLFRQAARTAQPEWLQNESQRTQWDSKKFAG
jgi:hypothetical protein